MGSCVGLLYPFGVCDLVFLFYFPATLMSAHLSLCSNNYQTGWKGFAGFAKVLFKKVKFSHCWWCTERCSEETPPPIPPELWKKNRRVKFPQSTTVALGRQRTWEAFKRTSWRTASWPTQNSWLPCLGFTPITSSQLTRFCCSASVSVALCCCLLLSGSLTICCYFIWIRQCMTDRTELKALL